MLWRQSLVRTTSASTPLPQVSSSPNGSVGKHLSKRRAPHRKSRARHCSGWACPQTWAKWLSSWPVMIRLTSMGRPSFSMAGPWQCGNGSSRVYMPAQPREFRAVHHLSCHASVAAAPVRCANLVCEFEAHAEQWVDPSVHLVDSLPMPSLTPPAYQMVIVRVIHLVFLHPIPFVELLFLQHLHHVVPWRKHFQDDLRGDVVLLPSRGGPADVQTPPVHPALI